MEWNFLFRVDHLNQKGEERNLKGLVFTEGKNPPSVNDIQSFLKECGFNVKVKDMNQLIFIDDNPQDPVQIRIVKMGNEQAEHHDAELRYLLEQFRRT
ncbi:MULTISPECIES: hypothetical protein [Paenibacillus]|uniref:Uncharacterized protein n=1 Tax=Paenibacillus lutrae TaxID=2078573 RepID=A0A7X3FK34_9BACL|nr:MULTISPECIES: hypothetical protein [Paenibacillus]MVP01201.1 hypothetical protein [Paenibacillus lutrae]